MQVNNSTNLGAEQPVDNTDVLVVRAYQCGHPSELPTRQQLGHEPVAESVPLTGLLLGSHRGELTYEVALDQDNQTQLNEGDHAALDNPKQEEVKQSLWRDPPQKGAVDAVDLALIPAKVLRVAHHQLQHEEPRDLRDDRDHGEDWNTHQDDQVGRGRRVGGAAVPAVAGVLLVAAWAVRLVRGGQRTHIGVGRHHRAGMHCALQAHTTVALDRDGQQHEVALTSYHSIYTH